MTIPRDFKGDINREIDHKSEDSILLKYKFHPKNLD